MRGYWEEAVENLVLLSTEVRFSALGPDATRNVASLPFDLPVTSAILHCHWGVRIPPLWT